MSPWGNSIVVNNLPKGWDDPWSATPGGDPIPALLNGPSPDSVFPLGGNYTTHPLDLQATAVDQWNVSYQKQLATDWMVSANYIGSITNHIWGTDQINPAVYSGGVDRQQHAIAPRVEHAEPGGRTAFRQYPGAR